MASDGKMICFVELVDIDTQNFRDSGMVDY